MSTERDDLATRAGQEVAYIYQVLGGPGAWNERVEAAAIAGARQMQAMMAGEAELLDAVMQHLDPATIPGLTVEQRVALAKWAKPHTLSSQVSVPGDMVLVPRVLSEDQLYELWSIGAEGLGRSQEGWDKLLASFAAPADVGREEMVLIGVITADGQLLVHDGSPLKAILDAEPEAPVGTKAIRIYAAAPASGEGGR